MNSYNRRKQEGATLVEMAFALPIILMLIMAVVDFGLYMFNDLQLSHTARDAARRASVAHTQAQWNEANAIVVDTVLVLATNTSGSSPLSPSFSAMRSGQDVTVRATGNYSFISPFLPLDIDLVATAVMRKE